jgi:hypothetical protein
MDYSDKYELVKMASALTLNQEALDEEGLNADALTGFLNDTRAYKPSEADLNDNAPGLTNFLNRKPKLNPVATDSSAVGWGRPITDQVMERHNRPWWRKLMDKFQRR